MTEVGIFVVPSAAGHESVAAQVLAADESGLDYVGVQDHPYQRRFLDTWTLLAYLAARTRRVHLVPDVLNLPLRLPAMIAKAATSLDLLSGGRVEIGLGAGAYWDAIEAMGGPRRTPKESVDAVEEALPILRAYLSGERSVTFAGRIYRVAGAHPGPPPTHAIGVWIGAYGPRMLALTGRLGDGWIPSLGGRFLADGDVAAMHARIDDAARRAGRDPSEIKRVVNLMALEGTPNRWRERLMRVADLGFETILVGVPDDDPVPFVWRLAEDVVPRLR